jgi:flagellar assembly protein FliH
MSSSPSRAAAPPAPPEIVPASPPVAVPFFYGEAVPLPGQRNFPRGEAGPVATKTAESVPPPTDPRRDAQLSEMGRQKGLAEARAAFEAQLVEVRAAVGSALTEFSRERARYYRTIEQQTVQLAVAIARKVIHRETQVDPLLLMGFVRVALERMEGATSVALKVHPGTLSDWSQYLASHLAAENQPEIVEDASIPRDGCILKTSMGTTQLGLELQLQEIEKGLLDLLAARPE